MTRFRVGVLWPLTAVMSGAIVLAFTVGVVAVVALGALAASSAAEVAAWLVLGLIVALTSGVLGVRWLLAGVTGFRPVLVGGGVVSVPVLAWYGIGRRELPFGAIAGVDLLFRDEARHRHWQLVVLPYDGPTLRCDSITSMHAKSSGVGGTPALAAVDEIRRLIRGR